MLTIESLFSVNEEDYYNNNIVEKIQGTEFERCNSNSLTECYPHSFDCECVRNHFKTFETYKQWIREK